jgi:hypothetical protein
VLPALMKRWEDAIARREGPPFLLTTQGATLKAYIREIKVVRGVRNLQTHSILDTIYASEFAGTPAPPSTAQSLVIGSVVNGTFQPVIRIRTATGVRAIKASEL